MAQILFNFLGPIRSIAIYIDSIVFGLIDNCFEIIMGFANSEFYKLDIIDDIRKKIYFVITLIALFRLAFLLINSLSTIFSFSIFNLILSFISLCK